MDFKPVVGGMELLKNSSSLRKMGWGCIVVAGLYVLLFGAAAVISAIRWW